MKMNAKKAMLPVAIAAFVSFSTAYAAWDDLKGGIGVVTFDTNNPDKIIYLDNIRPAEASLGFGTDRTGFNTQLKYSNTTGMRTYSPTWLTPGVYFDPVKSNATYTRLTGEGPFVWTHISKSAGAECLVNQTNCPQPGQVNSSSTCTYTKVKANITGEFGISAERDVSIKNVNISTSTGTGLTVDASWEKGWQSCQNEGSFHSCPPDQNLAFNAVNYATTESRSRFGWQRFQTPQTFYFLARYHATDATNCSKLGGNYVAGGFLIPPLQGRCELTSTGQKPSWERFERMPISDSASFPAIVPECRTIKRA